MIISSFQSSFKNSYSFPITKENNDIMLEKEINERGLRKKEKNVGQPTNGGAQVASTP